MEEEFDWSKRQGWTQVSPRSFFLAHGVVLWGVWTTNNCFVMWVKWYHFSMILRQFLLFWKIGKFPHMYHTDGLPCRTYVRIIYLNSVQYLIICLFGHWAFFILRCFKACHLHAIVLKDLLYVRVCLVEFLLFDRWVVLVSVMMQLPLSLAYQGSQYFSFFMLFIHDSGEDFAIHKRLIIKFSSFLCFLNQTRHLCSGLWHKSESKSLWLLNLAIFPLNLFRRIALPYSLYIFSFVLLFAMISVMLWFMFVF